MQQTSDSEEVRRTTSPPNARVVVKAGPNGVATQPFPTSGNGKGKTPVRPPRDDDDVLGLDDGEMSSIAEPGVRERVLSPDRNQELTRSNTAPTAGSMVAAAARATSPGGQAPSMASVAMSRNATRSASPLVDRARSPETYQGPLRSGSPVVVNGLGHAGTKQGSTGNVTADLIRDLKVKEAEVDAMKKREQWMKAVLLKASRAGFIYADADVDGPDGIVQEMESSEPKVAEVVVNLKQLRARLQVRASAGL